MKLTDNGYKELACAVINKARKDYGKAKHKCEIQRFFNSEECELYLELAGIHISGKELLKIIAEDKIQFEKGGVKNGKARIDKTF